MTDIYDPKWYDSPRVRRIIKEHKKLVFAESKKRREKKVRKLKAKGKKKLKEQMNKTPIGSKVSYFGREAWVKNIFNGDDFCSGNVYVVLASDSATLESLETEKYFVEENLEVIEVIK